MFFITGLMDRFLYLMYATVHKKLFSLTTSDELLFSDSNDENPESPFIRMHQSSSVISHITDDIPNTSDHIIANLLPRDRG
jgi:hypothetical protein